MRLCVSLPLCLSLLACSEADAPEAPGAPSEGRYGLVVLSHAYGERGVSVSGQFMAYEGFTREAALHALLPVEDAWRLRGMPEPGGCLSLATSAPDTAGAIDLLGAGPLRVRPPGPLDHTAIELAPRPFPTVLFALSGVVYDAGAPQQLPFLAGGTYRVHAAGGEVGEVFAEVSAPEGVRITSHRGGAQTGLEVRWSGASTAFVTLSRDAGTRTLGVVCGGESGRAFVPPSALARLGADTLQLEVARAERSSTAIAGLDDADVVFVSRDTVDLRLGSH